MILTCPDCATRYMTKPEAIGPNGRTVRCASCSATWYVAAPDLVDSAGPAAPVAAAVPAPTPRPVRNRRPRAKNTEGRSVADPVNTPEPEAEDFAPPSAAGLMRQKTEQKRAARRLMSVGAMWLVTLSILSAAALSAYVYRQDVVEAYPQSATLYKAFGVNVAKGGLVFGRVITRSALVEGTPTLIVEGEVHNPGREGVNARLVQLSLHDPSGQVLTAWQVEMPADKIGKGETLSFATQYPNQPVDAVSLKYNFAGDVSADSGDASGDLGGAADGNSKPSSDRAALAPRR